MFLLDQLLRSVGAFRATLLFVLITDCCVSTVCYLGLIVINVNIVTITTNVTIVTIIKLVTIVTIVSSVSGAT